MRTAAGRRIAGIAAAPLLLMALGAPPAVAGTEEVAVLRVPQGEIVWRFLPKDAPGHVEYVKHLIETGFYDGTTFHRVIPHFVVQGGDPNSKNDDRADDGEGEGDRRLKAEFSNRLHYRPGTIGMARDADPDSGSCQFFIALENLPRLDTRYTIFAEVVSGLEVARRVAAMPRDLNDNPLEPIKMTIRLEKRPLKEQIASSEAGRFGSGEVLTGPDKPKWYDPKNRLWAAPARVKETIASDPAWARRRLELAVGPDGQVIDVRFPEPVPDAMRMLALVQAWVFAPVLYDGKPQKVRFEMDADGTRVGPPLGGGAPIDLTGSEGEAADGSLRPPRPAVKVTIPAGAAPPPRPAVFRLTVDATGSVIEAALQSSCGVAALDARAADAARSLAFEPAMRKVPGHKDPEPAAVYLEIAARFVAGD